MTTQQFSFKSPATPQRANAFAIFFFLLGAPNIYSVLQRRSHSKTGTPTKSLPFKSIGWLIAIILGATSFLVF